MNKGSVKRALVISSYPAPYRVGVFKELAEEYDLEIYFDTCQNENRNKDWFCKNDNFYFEILDNEAAKNKFKSAIKKIKQYDFVIAYDPARKPAIKAIIECQIHGVPYFVNNDGAFLNKNFLKDLIKRFLFRKAAACFSSGRSATEYFKYYGVSEDKIFEHKFTSLTKDDILTAPTDDEEKKRMRTELKLPEKKTVITVGQFIFRKGFDILIKAWEDIGDNALLLIIGGGEEKAGYEEYIKSHNIKGIKLIDFMQKQELYRYYSASDIFVLPTREDVWGLVVNEAMAFGLPIITTDKCNAGLELIEDDINGYIVKTDDPIELRERLRYLLENPEVCYRMSEHNLNKIKEYTLENIAKEHIKAINKVLDF